MDLISMTDFVLEQDKAPFFHYDSLWEKIINYANFLKQSLKLEMFVPCDEDGNVMQESEYTVENYGHSDIGIKFFEKEKLEYNKAKEKCLFEGFELILQNEFYYTLYRKMDGCSILLEKSGNRTIEYLIQYEIKLTPTGIKQIGF